LLATPQSAPIAAVPAGRRSYTPAGSGEEIITDFYHHLFVASDFLNKRFIPVIAEVYARTIAEFGELLRHAGEEFAFVLEGAVEFHSEFYAPLLMHKGDSLYFDSSMGHAYLAAAPGPCRVLSICSGPESQLKDITRKDFAGADPNDLKRASASKQKR
jgi:hypothetical protein